MLRELEGKMKERETGEENEISVLRERNIQL